MFKAFDGNIFQCLDLHSISCTSIVYFLKDVIYYSIYSAILIFSWPATFTQPHSLPLEDKQKY